MSHSLVSRALPFLCASVLRTTAVQFGLFVALGGCSPKDRDFRRTGTGDAGGATGGSGGHGAGAGGGSDSSAQGSGGAGGEGGGVGGVECFADQAKCSENTQNTPQRCVDGRWEDAEPCPAAAPACDAGKCVPPSCVGLAETCGPDGNESCCATTAIPGGRFNRSNDERYPATVSRFFLDRFEVTVGRFRRFVEAYPGSKPAAGAGAHPLIEGSGWNADWASQLPDGLSELTALAMCNPNFSTWTDAAGGHEHLPMNCLNWYVAFAFCAWDGGRLATEAEWNYAAAGGDEQRAYPWSNPASSTTIDDTYAVYGCTGDGTASGGCAFSDIRPVGSRSPTGDGRWGQSDLSGSLWEWALDWYADYNSDCSNCANTTSASSRVVRGGSFDDDASLPYLLSSARSSTVDPSYRNDSGGARCARSP
ncbi:SUMF1/EgtB/PvdO family nonheme iron enzyme [Sorangium sp. So ce375]|uniref:formylglycine-generating enzyme family protein n=1 Tax=Sorangium sp. So ce375 TaxID=3133306 RepID=UPI003F5BEB5B